MSPVQQQLSEINNRYSLLGVKLSDRQNELDTIREEVRKHIDSLKNLSLFLDKVIIFSYFVTTLSSKTCYIFYIFKFRFNVNYQRILFQIPRKKQIKPINKFVLFWKKCMKNKVFLIPLRAKLV